jgi:hypothetical protein
MKLRAYLDIETTGLSRSFSDITVIGIAVEKNGKLKTVQLLEKTLTEKKLLAALSGIDELYSYNGSRFDLPFIKVKFGVDLKKQYSHTDLMYKCWKNNLKGGLKAVERKLCIHRNLKDVDGFMAAQLWWEYKNYKDEDALKTLLEYNREDIVNLKVLREKLSVD